MNLEEDILIEHFLRDQLSEEEKSDFLNKVANEPDFREKFLLEKQLFETLNEDEWSYASKIDTQEVKEYTQLYQDNAPRITQAIQKAKTNHNRKSKVRKLIYYTAAAAAFIALLINFYPQQNQPTINEIYAHYSGVYELPSLVSRNSETTDLDLISAENSYKRKNYREAILHINNLLEKDKDNSSLYIYKALSHGELGEFALAEESLDLLIARDLIDSEKSYWYKSLLYVKSKDIDSSKQMLNIIIKNSYFNHKEAKQLLKDLDGLKN